MCIWTVVICMGLGASAVLAQEAVYSHLSTVAMRGYPRLLGRKRNPTPFPEDLNITLKEGGEMEVRGASQPSVNLQKCF